MFAKGESNVTLLFPFLQNIWPEVRPMESGHNCLGTCPPLTHTFANIANIGKVKGVFLAHSVALPRAQALCGHQADATTLCPWRTHFPGLRDARPLEGADVL